MNTLSGICRVKLTRKDYELINGLYIRHVRFEEAPTTGPLAKYFRLARENRGEWIEWWQPETKPKPIRGEP